MAYKQPESLDFFLRKIGVIVYISILNFVITAIVSQVLEKYLITPYDDEREFKMNVWYLCICVSVIAIAAYLLRQVSELVPLPFKSDTFEPSKVKEVKGSVFTAFTLFLFLADDLKSFQKMLQIF